jgi:hypothetical protein
VDAPLSLTQSEPTASDGARASSKAGGTRGIVPAPPSSTRYDGGPEEGTRGSRQSSAASSSQVYVNPSTGYAGTRYDDGPEEGTGGPTACCGHRP